MKQQKYIENFDDLCQIYSIWILKYLSNVFDKPLFFLWFTDTDEASTDKLLTNKSGKIVAVQSITALKPTLLANIDQLNIPENLNNWLHHFKDLTPTENCIYNFISLENSIHEGNLDITTIESVVNFINLYTDFVGQDDKNLHLSNYRDDKLVQKIWDYYYDYIFYPRFNDKEKFENWNRPPLSINTQKLALKFRQMKDIFDKNICIL